MGPLVIGMVGLPARGKTFVASQMSRYLAWQGVRAQIFNVGNRRRALFGAKVPHGFFDPSNPNGMASRREAAQATMDEVLAFFADGGEVALYDATNTTHSRRSWVREVCSQNGIQVAFVELSCDDNDIIERNIRQTKLFSPDYTGVQADEAVADFRRRIDHYSTVYEPLGDGDPAWVRLVDAGRQFILTDPERVIPRRLTDYLANLSAVPRTIWVTRHGQSEFNTSGQLGGDSPLSPAGQRYAHSLGEFFRPRPVSRVWSSTLRRARQTASALGTTHSPRRALDEIDAGVCDGLTYAEIAARRPNEFAARQADKLGYRYPGGESYADVIERLDPMVLDLERTRGPVLLVAHQAIIRSLLGYFLDIPREEIPHVDVPLHTVIALHPHGPGYREERFPLDPRL